MTTTAATQSGKTGQQRTDTEFMGRVIRLAMYMTHYKQPLNWTEQRLNQANKALVKFLKHAEYDKKQNSTPIEFLEALTNDLNTVQAIVIMHTLCREKRYGELWQCMHWLGLLPNTLPKEVDELKLLPEELSNDKAQDFI